LAYIDQNEVN